MWLNTVIRMGDTNQFDTNTCHHTKKIGPDIKSFAFMLRLSKVSD